MWWLLGLLAAGGLTYAVVEANATQPATPPQTGVAGGTGPVNVTITLGAVTWPYAVAPGSVVTFLPPSGTTQLPSVSTPQGGAAVTGPNVVALATAGTFVLTLLGVAVPMTYDGADLAPTAAPADENPIVFDAGERYMFSLTFTAPIGLTDYRAAAESYFAQLEDMNGTPQPDVFTIVGNIRSGSGKLGRSSG